MKTKAKPIGNPGKTQRLRLHDSPNLGQSQDRTRLREVGEGRGNGAPLNNRCSTGVPGCDFCNKAHGHEPWCQVSSEWIALDAVWDAAECISEATTIEALYDLAKQRPDTECLTLEMVRELVNSWVEIGEWEEVDGKFRKMEGE